MPIIIKQRNSYNQPGRWPANVIFDEETAEILDQQSGIRKSGSHKPIKEKTLQDIAVQCQNNQFFKTRNLPAAPPGSSISQKQAQQNALIESIQRLSQ